ncbi:MAG: inorganic phosphate transporter, partial [Deltaproteobacteria bacterium]|nr:inorganic phosphate transporter [Deltaproteobacteria bacterium]
MLAFVIFIVVLALIFDFLNGMNDAANSIATVVSTRVLSPRLAVLWAAFFNLAAAFFFGVHVAT